MRSWSGAAPAKLNWHLEILGRAADGYHRLETVFQTLAWADTVRIDRRPGPATARLTITDRRPQSISITTCPAGNDNLVVRAVEAYRRVAPDLGAIDIHLTKQLPIAGGLGGGSSDAAAVLRGLALLCPRPDFDLAGLARELGADVAFFLIGGTAHGGDRGDRLTPLPDAPDRPIWLLLPACACPTPAVFAALSETERGPRQAHGPAAWALGDPAEHLHNRLSDAAGRVSPLVTTLLQRLAAAGCRHLLAGSGSTVFSLDPPPAGLPARVFRTRLRSASDLDCIDLPA